MVLHLEIRTGGGPGEPSDPAPLAPLPTVCPKKKTCTRSRLQRTDFDTVESAQRSADDTYHCSSSAPKKEHVHTFETSALVLTPLMWHNGEYMTHTNGEYMTHTILQKIPDCERWKSERAEDGNNNMISHVGALWSAYAP